VKTIKIKYVGFWEGFQPKDHYLHRTLEKLYDVQITDNPDYIICSCFDEYCYLEYPQIRIMCSGENFIPDFNLIDYGVSVYPLDFMDRHFSFPGMVGWPDPFYELMKKKRNYTNDILYDKDLFANLIYSHDSENCMRSELYHLLSQYKRVESPGPLLYNMLGGERVSRSDGSKEALQRRTKFTLCCESTCHEGFVTEKIFEAFLADTIPVYCGSSTITDIFNRDAFINISDYDNLQDVVERIKELDQNDEAYLQMLRQPIFHDPDYIQRTQRNFESFLRNIFDQPIETAYRRSRVYAAAKHEKTLKQWRQLMIEHDGSFVINRKWKQILKNFF